MTLRYKESSCVIKALCTMLSNETVSIVVWLETTLSPPGLHSNDNWSCSAQMMQAGWTSHCWTRPPKDNISACCWWGLGTMLLHFFHSFHWQICPLHIVKYCHVFSVIFTLTRGGKSTKIFYSSKSTITLLKFYLSTSKSTSLKIYSSKSKK